MKTVKSIPPQILQYFSSTLLSSPYSKFRDWSEDIWKVYLYVKEKLIPKCKNNPIRLKKTLELEKQFLELYERAKVKEKANEGKNQAKTEQFGYSFREFDRYNQRIFGRLRFKC
jgi:hypothetical protein